ncbi:MAG: hypothetical protein U1E23_15475 [Reyranellaceae bacterium]
MTASLKRLSSDYEQHEDRIRLIGESESGETVVMWITQRLLGRVVTALLQILEKESPEAAQAAGGREIVQSFAQEAAVAGLKRQEPVAAQQSTPTWLVHTVDVTPAAPHVALAFRSRQGEAAAVRFHMTELRQWLAILHSVWVGAHWPAALWPGWIASGTASSDETIRH